MCTGLSKYLSMHSLLPTAFCLCLWKWSLRPLLLYVCWVCKQIIFVTKLASQDKTCIWLFRNYVERGGRPSSVEVTFQPNSSPKTSSVVHKGRSKSVGARTKSRWNRSASARGMY